MLNLSKQKQAEIINHVRDTFKRYDEGSSEWRKRMKRVYEGVSTFSEKKNNSRDTAFKINKLHEIENRILPRIMSKNPKPIVSYVKKDLIESELDVNEIATAVGDRLAEIYEKQDMIESLRLWARGGVRYGLCFAKLIPKYRIARTPKDEEVSEYDEVGNENKVIKKKINEDVYEQYTGIEIKSFSEMYFDHNYTRLEDMPSIIDVSRNIRLSYFTKNRKRFTNVDDLIKCCNTKENGDTVLNITGFNELKGRQFNKETLEVECYYGLYDITEDASLQGYENEKLYEFWIVNGCILVEAKEISCMPYEDFRVFEDTETFYATGLLEPILGMQDELNWKKNRASEYINKTIKPDYIRSPLSGIDPRKINQGHGNLLMTTKPGQVAMENFVQLKLPDLNASYFNEQNDLERQMQSASFTVNTNQPITQNSLTETATGAKIQSFETDSVTGEIRGHFEEALVRLTYKILQFEYENMEFNIDVKVQGEEDAYRNIHKEAIRDAVTKYAIEIEAGSSSADNVAERRNDAIALWNLEVQGMDKGLPVNLKKQLENIVSTFPNAKVSELYDQQAMMAGMQPQGMGMPQGQQPQAPTSLPPIPMQ